MPNIDVEATDAGRLIREAVARATSGIELWDDGFEIVGSQNDSDDQLAFVPGTFTPEQVAELAIAPLDLITDNRTNGGES